MNSFLLLLLSCGGLSVDYMIDEVETGISLDTEVVETDYVFETDVVSDTSFSDTDTTVITPTGLYGGVLRFTRLDVPCPECFYEYTTTTRVSSVLALHPPVNRSWNEWIPPAGTCTGFVSQTDPSTQFYNIGASAQISDQVNTLTLSRVYNQGQPEYRMESQYPNDFSYYSFYGLETYPNNSLGEFFIENALHTPEQLFLLTPVEILSTVNTAFPPVVYRSGTSFAWEPTGSGLFFVIVDVYDEYGYYYLGGSLCVGDDNGSMFVTGLSQFPVGSLLAIYMYRYEITETMIPANGSTLEGVGQVGIVGTATLAN
jgi:hypothetical protein